MRRSKKTWRERVSPYRWGAPIAQPDAVLLFPMWTSRLVEKVRLHRLFRLAVIKPPANCEAFFVARIPLSIGLRAVDRGLIAIRQLTGGC